MEYAIERLIDSVWTLGFEITSEGTITIHTYDRENPIGYEKERELSRIKIIETEGRVISEVWVSEKPMYCWESFTDHPHTKYKVDNPQYIFSYK